MTKDSSSDRDTTTASSLNSKAPRELADALWTLVHVDLALTQAIGLLSNLHRRIKHPVFLEQEKGFLRVTE